MLSTPHPSALHHASCPQGRGHVLVRNRRAERAVVPLVESGDCEVSVAVFLNRLSDFLFMAARFTAKQAGREEVQYKKAKDG